MNHLLRLNKDQQHLHSMLAKVVKQQGKFLGKFDADELLRLFIELGQVFLLTAHMSAEQRNATFANALGTNPDLIVLAAQWARLHELGAKTKGNRGKTE